MENNNKISRGIIHIHTEDSLKDSAMSCDRMCERAKELGAPAIVLTDHGTLTGVDYFLAAAKKYGIKAIPGVEGYYEEDDNLTHRAHIVLIPKDIDGYRAICNAVTASNHRLDSQNIPRMNMEIFESNFGKGSLGHGHVIATSACMVGVIASVLLRNNSVQKDINKIELKRSRLRNPNSPLYLSNVKKVEEIEEKVQEMNDKITELSAIAKKPYTKKEKALKTLEGKPEYQERKEALDAEKAESENAKNEVENLKRERTSLKTKQKEYKDRCAESKKDHEKWTALTEQIEKLEASKESEEEIYVSAKNAAEKYVSIFGNGNFYCELQNHGIEEEAYVFPLIAKIADELNIPVLATNDAHMPTNSDDDVKARQIMRSLRFNQWEEISESDKELYIKTDAELSEALLKILPKETVEKAMAGIGDIIDACNVEFAEEKHYPTFKSEIEGENAYDCLRRMALKGIEWRYPNREGWTEEHEKRMEYEFEVIKKLGVCDYLCIVEDFLRYGRLLGKLDKNNPDPRYLADPYNMKLLEEITKDEIGVGIGPGRGSAVGSLVCYLSGITSVDPMKYNLIFERFLNSERVSMPDIDSDFRPDIREKVLDYVKNKYGPNAVCCIMTRGTQQARAAIRNCARLYGSQMTGDTKQFLNLGDEIAKAIPDELGVKFCDCVDDLENQFASNKDALTIIHNALLVEGVFTNVGMHAAGVIISDNGDVSKYVPLMYITGTEQFATQCDKDQAEAKGLLKMDFLGLRNLGIINETVRLVREKDGKRIDIERVPFESEVFKKIFAEGNTNSVFQFESSGMKQMLKQFKPESIEDIILLVAAYRPGPIQYLDSVISVKNGRKKPEYVIPEMESVLGQTYGSPIYQEQIMQIFNKFAGFSLGESDIIRRYMSKKKTEKFMAYKDKFVNGMIERGGKPEKVEEFWNQLIEFSKYAFNKSHAAAYAFVAYYTAWLKYHYTSEYLCAVMNDTEFEKLGGLISDCKTFEINVRPANINQSMEGFSICDKEIICGLGNIKNVGNSSEAIIDERNANGNFVSFSDFLLRTKARKDVTESLIKAGAFDEFCKNRTSLVNAVGDYVEIVNKIKKKEIVFETEIDETKKNKALISINVLKESLKDISVDNSDTENLKVRLFNEKQMVGAFVSGHPLDAYLNPSELKCENIDSLTKKDNVSIMGMVTNLRIAKRKSDGSEMAFFKLEDKTGVIDVCCFAKEYKYFGKLISEDAVLKISGGCQEDTSSFNDSEENKLKIMAKNIEMIKENKKTITLFVPNIMEWTDHIYEHVKPYQDESGYPLLIFDRMTGMFRKTNILVNKDILQNNLGLEATM